MQWDTEIIVGKYSKAKDGNNNYLPEYNWVWSPQGIINMHYPERWGYLRFTRKNETEEFKLPYYEKQKQYLWLLYYRQKKYFSGYNCYAKSLNEFGINKPMVMIERKKNEIKMEATSHQFTVYINDGTSGWSINDEGFVQYIKLISFNRRGFKSVQ